MTKHPKPLANYLSVFRRKAGLTQRELAILVGYAIEDSISNHERLYAVPPFLIALSYEVIFQAPIGELFSGLRSHIEQIVEERISDLQTSLEQQDKLGRTPARNARKLEWLTMRRPQPSLRQ